MSHSIFSSTHLLHLSFKRLRAPVFWYSPVPTPPLPKSPPCFKLDFQLYNRQRAVTHSISFDYQLSRASSSPGLVVTWTDCGGTGLNCGEFASKRRNHVISIWQKEQGRKRSHWASSEDPGWTDRARTRQLDTSCQWFEAKRTRGGDTVPNPRWRRQYSRQFDRKWEHTKSGAWTRSTWTTRFRFIGTSSILHQSMYEPVGRRDLWQNLCGFVHTLKVMLILCLCSVVHELLPMVLLQASIQQPFTPGLNDNSPSHPNNQILSRGMVRRSMPPRPKRETYI